VGAGVQPGAQAQENGARQGTVGSGQGGGGQRDRVGGGPVPWPGVMAIGGTLGCARLIGPASSARQAAGVPSGLGQSWAAQGKALEGVGAE